MSGVANMAQGITSLNRLRSAIKAFPLRIRSAIAKDAEAVLTTAVQDAYDDGKTVYDTARPLSVAGKALTLKRSNKTRGSLAFVAIGTIVRAQLSTSYAKYLVGKYKILPAALPAGWRVKIEKLVAEYRDDWARENGASL